MSSGWSKSSRSYGGDNCVEVRLATAEIGVRDSKERSGPALSVSMGAWGTFLAAAKSGRLDGRGGAFRLPSTLEPAPPGRSQPDR